MLAGDPPGPVQWDREGPWPWVDLCRRCARAVALATGVLKTMTPTRGHFALALLLAACLAAPLAARLPFSASAPPPPAGGQNAPPFGRPRTGEALESFIHGPA